MKGKSKKANLMRVIKKIQLATHALKLKVNNKVFLGRCYQVTVDI